nr:lactonase family protein [uncultured Pedobacter sp.]
MNCLKKYKKQIGPWVTMLLLPLIGFSQKKDTALKTFDLLIGTYTRTNESKGIMVYRFDDESGKMTYLNQIDGVENPAFLTVSSDLKFVYAINSNKVGEVSSFKFDLSTGKLEFINKQSSSGVGPAHITIDRDSKNVFVSNYGSGSLTVLPVKGDGSLAQAVQNIQDEGGSANKLRQEGPHVHSALLSKNEKILFYADLGTDKINIYNYDSSKKTPLTPANPAFESVQAGNGPRHMDFSPDQKYLYLVQEMMAVVNVYSYNNGKLTFLQSVRMMPESFTENSAADIHVSPDGLFLYASNRGNANNIVAYAINKKNGRLTFVERYDVDKTPRNFLITPSGNFMLVAAQDANSVTAYKINKATGKLTLTSNKIEVGQPVCLKLVPVE